MLSDRETEVIRLVGRFGQLRPFHIRQGLFGHLASATPLDRALRKLVKGNYLVRTHQNRQIGGLGGGERVVCQLGREGWKFLGCEGTYRLRAVNDHTLAIADPYAALASLETAGSIERLKYLPEPACHRKVGDILLTPDARADVVLNGWRGLRRVSYFVEVDLATEDSGDIKAKCARYWAAAVSPDWPEHKRFPYVLFVVETELHRDNMEKWIAKGSADWPMLCKVTTLDGIGDFMASQA